MSAGFTFIVSWSMPKCCLLPKILSNTQLPISSMGLRLSSFKKEFMNCQEISCWQLMWKDCIGWWIPCRKFVMKMQILVFTRTSMKYTKLSSSNWLKTIKSYSPYHWWGNCSTYQTTSSKSYSLSFTSTWFQSNWMWSAKNCFSRLSVICSMSLCNC